MCQEPFIRQLKNTSLFRLIGCVIRHSSLATDQSIRQEKVRKMAWLVTSDSVSWDSLRTTKHVGYTVWWLQILMASMQHWLAMTTAYTCMNVRRTTERSHGINHSAHVTRRWTRDNDVVECGSASHLHVAMDTPVWGWRRKLVARRTLAQVKAARFGILASVVQYSLPMTALARQHQLNRYDIVHLCIWYCCITWTIVVVYQCSKLMRQNSVDK